MKNCIWKGLCLFFILMPLLMSLIVLPSAAQSGQGGSTEVIARIEPATAASEIPTQPFTEPSSPQDHHPIPTGESVIWITATVLISAAALILIIRLRSGQKEPSSRIDDD